LDRNANLSEFMINFQWKLLSAGIFWLCSSGN
jgi:hypothetical protein